MSKIKWDEAGKRYYENGVSKGVLYVMSSTPGTYGTGVAWNGLTAITESPQGAEVTAIYADNIKYLNLISAEELNLTIEAYTYPDDFGACDGSVNVKAGTSTPADIGVRLHQQGRKQFALCYQTKIGNDQNSELGYKLHIVYGCIASPSERAYETINDSPDAMTFSWEVTTTPVDVEGYKPTSHIVIDSRTADSTKLAALLDTLYGKDASTAGGDATEPTLVMPDDIITALS